MHPQSNTPFDPVRASYWVLGQFQPILPHATRRPAWPWPVERLLFFSRHRLRRRLRLGFCDVCWHRRRHKLRLSLRLVSEQEARWSQDGSYLLLLRMSSHVGMCLPFILFHPITNINIHSIPCISTNNNHPPPTTAIHIHLHSLANPPRAFTQPLHSFLVYLIQSLNPVTHSQHYNNSNNGLSV